MEEIKVGYVTIDATQYESLIRENARIHYENLRLSERLHYQEELIERIENTYQNILNERKVN